VENALNPVRIKVWGLIWLTRRWYLILLAVAAVLAVVLLGMWHWRWPAAREQLRAARTPTTDFIVAFCDAGPWIVLVIALLQGIEAFVILRMFKRREAEQQVQPPNPSPDAVAEPRES